MTRPTRRPGGPAPDPVPPPIEVRRAALGVYVVSVCYLLLAVFAILTRDAAITIAQESETTNLTDAEVVAAVNAVVLIQVVVGVGVAAAGAVSAINLVRGRRWARLTATIAVSIALLFSLLGALGSGAVAVAVHLLVIISGAAALFFLYRRSASAFFARLPVR